MLWPILRETVKGIPIEVLVQHAALLIASIVLLTAERTLRRCMAARVVILYMNVVVLFSVIFPFAIGSN